MRLVVCYVPQKFSESFTDYLRGMMLGYFTHLILRAQEMIKMAHNKKPVNVIRKI